MKIANSFKNANVKALFTKAALCGLAAGAAFMATPQKANAQVVIGLHFGHRPAYYAPAPVYAPAYNYGYYAPVQPAYSYGYNVRRDWDDRGRDFDRRRDFDRHDFDRRDGDRDRHFDGDRR